MVGLIDGNKQTMLFLASAAVILSSFSSSSSIVAAFGVSPCHRHHRPRTQVFGSSTNYKYSASSKARTLKDELVAKVTEFIELKERDGDVAIDFGVKGGELNETSRAPQKIDFFKISNAVGEKAEEIIDICKQLAAEYNSTSSTGSNDTLVPTIFLGDKENGDKSPLNGPWKLLFTTAADANFSKVSCSLLIR